MRLISIYRRNDTGYYCAEYFNNKKRNKITLRTKNRSEAEKIWQDFFNKYEKNLKKFSVENQVEIDKAFKELIELKQKKLQLSTLKPELYKIKKFEEFIKKQNIKFVSQITDDIIRQFFETLENKSPKTINNCISLINTILKYFYDKKYTNHKFDNSIYWQKKEKKKVQIINIDEAKKIIEYCKGIKRIDSRVLMLNPFYTGMRFSEIKALNKRNINFDQKYILICEKQTHADPKPIQILKSIKAFRKVPILKEYEELLKEFLEIKQNDYLFSDITYWAVMYHCEQINKKLNLPVKFNYHQARHFFASLLIDNNFNIKEVQSILGHETIEITLNTYGHLIKSWDIEKFNNIKF